MTTIIGRYLTSQILRLFGVILTMVIGIYVVVDFFEKVDEFLAQAIPMSRALVFFVFKIPFIVSQVLPLCFLLSVLITFGVMNKNNEITALKSSGVSVYFLFKPVLTLGVALSILLFALTEIIIPVTSVTVNTIWLKEVRKKPAVVSQEKNIWIKGSRSISHIKYYDAAKKTLHGITLYQFDPAFRLTRRIDGESGVYRDGQWFLQSVMAQQLKGGLGESRMTFHRTMVIALDFTPEDFKRAVKQSEEMNYRELRRFIEKVEAEGYDATTYRVDLHAKVAFPFVCVIMCLVGIGIAAKGKIGEGLAVAVAYGIGIAFLYWILYSFSLSLGRGEMLPPLLASWIANFVFLCLGVYMLLSAE